MFGFSLANLSALRARGVLGMNRRNIAYISRYNPRQHFPLVDNKLKTKQLALEYDVVVPELISVIDNQHDVNFLEQRLLGRDGFCIKPAKGSGGKGILVIQQCHQGQYCRSNGQVISLDEIKRHVSNILAGLFSLGGTVDVAVVEALIEGDENIARYSHEGVPDLRLIVFRGIPIMAMMRLACAASQGKANLHQGAVGVGIDIATGRAVHAVQDDRRIENHPDTGLSLAELQIPHWQALLELGCACADMTGLGYLGVDLVLDKNIGPALLELNARPGLSIQIANGKGLLPRLKAVEALSRPERLSVPDRVAYAYNHFAA
ncbi:alpha-L-glutamate ligase-like protein [Teredinibacter franksiae]|jgi:alpha-L-glutamate ligase-related protein|uniref:alpha-L-glutamate ligase-like protein n=1 Tax=Teredinibacter franksiae TaxID=2761453 RepID=UPI00162625AA|nr:alpha-L-glutamate ligase-like protein [Teredinibacter franksiae]